MQKHPEITKKRLKTFLREHALLGKIYPAKAPVSLSVFKAPGRIPFPEAMKGHYQALQVGTKLGPAWATFWVKVDIQLPSAWRGKEVHFLWDSSSEACVWQNALPLQGLSGSGASVFVNSASPLRTAFPLGTESRQTLFVEVACNELFGIGKETGLLRQAEIALFDREAWDLLWDYTVIADMAEHLPSNSPRGAQALWTANAMINATDLDDPKTWAATRRIAKQFLSSRNGDGQHRVSAIGHAHIDTAWLWPIAETKRKCYRTFSSALRLMQEYPDYKFVCSQAQQLEWIKKEQPDLYKQVKKAATKGSFIPAGGSWVEPDCNIPSGESLVRQFLFGQHFFKTEFGEYCREFWNPDVFGYNGQLPQIMRGAGIDNFLTQKLSWNQMNKPLAHTFWWEGIDGSRVLTHFPPADTYNGKATVKELLYNVSNYKDLERSNESYYLFGIGDGGGGPTPEMLEQLQRMKNVDGLPRVEQRSPREFFHRLRQDMHELTTQVGELYFELHRGTYTTQAANKRDNRRSENLLHDLEFLGVISERYPREQLQELWKKLLTNQFHDIIPGSSIREVYEDSARDYEEILAKGKALQANALASLLPKGKKSLAVVNTTSHARREVISVDGKLAMVQAPAYGIQWQVPNTEVENPASLSESKAGYTLENSRIRARLNRKGQLLSLVDKSLGKETILGEANQFVLFEDEPMAWDAWDVDIYHLETRKALPGAHQSRVIERDALRVSLEFEYQLTAKSSLKQHVSLSADSMRLEFSCECDWQEDHKFLKVEFPTTIRSDRATYEIQFGHLQRPTHFNASVDLARFEVCAYRWADLSETGAGLALLNDSKYGYATHGNVMRLSLLRAPSYPDAKADRGRHQFRYALVPHGGDLQSAGIVREAQCFNQSLIASYSKSSPKEISFFQSSNPAVVIDTVKLAEDSDDTILRLYESHGSHCSTKILSAQKFSAAYRCNLLEENERKISSRRGVELQFRPFEIITLRLKK